MGEKDKAFLSKSSLNINGNLLDLTYPVIMGAINTTPDSFFISSRKSNVDDVLREVGVMVEEGASIIDIGGYSSRPGAKHISDIEEIKRTKSVISSIHKQFPDIPISIDTFRSNVAEEALEVGASIINDISGGELDDKMFDLIVREKVPYIMMHMRGTPQNMKDHTSYEDIFSEMVDYFRQKICYLTDRGVSDLIVDPGFGFAKTINQNFKLLNNLEYFNILDRPLLVGLSRKSMIYKSLGITPEEALNGTTVLNTVALMKGAKILRVHDVKECNELVKLYKNLVIS